MSKIERFVAMIFDIGATFDPTKFPQTGVGKLIAEAQFAALINDPADHHGERRIDPGLGSGIEHPVEPQILGKFEQSVAGPEFPGGENFKSIGRISWDNALAKSKLQQFELVKRATRDPAVLGVNIFANGFVSKGGAQQPDRIFA